MGQELFNPPNVKGWPGGRYWIRAGTGRALSAAEALFDGKEAEGLEPLGRSGTLLARGRDGPGSMLDRLDEDSEVRASERTKDGLQAHFVPGPGLRRNVPGASPALVDGAQSPAAVGRPSPPEPRRPDRRRARDPAPERAKVAAADPTSPEYQIA